MPRQWLRFTPNDVPIVFIGLHQERTAALIDTGSHVSLISPQLAARFSLPIIGHTPIIGVTGLREVVDKTRIEDLRLGQTKLGPIEASIVDVERLGRKIKLILGVNAFRNRKLQINFSEGKAYLLD